MSLWRRVLGLCACILSSESKLSFLFVDCIPTRKFLSMNLSLWVSLLGPFLGLASISLVS